MKSELGKQVGGAEDGAEDGEIDSSTSSETMATTTTGRGVELTKQELWMLFVKTKLIDDLVMSITGRVPKNEKDARQIKGFFIATPAQILIFVIIMILTLFTISSAKHLDQIFTRFVSATLLSVSAVMLVFSIIFTLIFTIRWWYDYKKEQIDGLMNVELFIEHFLDSIIPIEQVDQDKIIHELDEFVLERLTKVYLYLQAYVEYCSGHRMISVYGVAEDYDENKESCEVMFDVAMKIGWGGGSICHSRDRIANAIKRRIDELGGDGPWFDTYYDRYVHGQTWILPT
jgi:hypothetical protein